VSPVLPVDLIDRLHQARPALVVYAGEDVLLPFGVRDDVAQEDACLVGDEAGLVGARVLSGSSSTGA